jgi:Asp-tRNA(Asn)/Glu-tRNA(Gln) amidotransferase A subunit family amidase
MTYTFQDAMAEVLPQVVPEYFWQKKDGELEFAVPGWDVTSVDYAVALAMHKAPLSPKLTLRRISQRLANPRGTFTINKYLAERGDARVTDWGAWVANAKFENDAQRAAAANAVGKQDGRADPNGVSYLKMQTALRMIILKVMYENGIDVFVNPDQTTAPYRLGYAGEPEVNDRPQISCCTAFTALGGMPEMEVPAGFTTISYDTQYELAPDRKDYLEVTGTVPSTMPPMPISMMFWSGPGSDAAVIHAGSAYESATHHRKPPPAFGPVTTAPAKVPTPSAAAGGQ